MLGVARRMYSPFVRRVCGRLLLFPDISIFMHLKMKEETQLIGCKGARKQSFSNLLQKAVENESQRL
jgi:hypothetical protein